MADWDFENSDWVWLRTKDFKYVDKEFLSETMHEAGLGRCVTRKGDSAATFEMKEPK